MEKSKDNRFVIIVKIEKYIGYMLTILLKLPRTEKITLDEYMKNANRIKEIVKGYEQNIKELEQELSGENDKTKNESRLDNLIEEFLNMEKPTKEIIREFIEKN